MKKRVLKSKIIIPSIILITILSIGLIIYYKNSLLSLEEKAIKLINISDLSPEFMDDYFKKYSKLSNQQKDHMLIAISKKKIRIAMELLK